MSSVDAGSIKQRYDDPMHHPVTREYYGQSDFFNAGYWLEDTSNQKEACENLMEKLLAFIPERKGTILDVACGLGNDQASSEILQGLGCGWDKPLRGAVGDEQSECSWLYVHTDGCRGIGV